MLESLQKMRGKRALITGASAGIGKACAISLAQNGVALYLTGRNITALNAVAEQCRALGVEVSAIPGDLTDRAFVRALANQAGDADYFVNNAGILTYAPLLETTVEDCEKMFATNVIAAYDIAREMAQRMVQRGAGHLLFVTSMSARNVGNHAVAYAATKHAMTAFAKGFRLELKAFNIKVTEVSPGMVDTDMRKDITHPEVLKAIASRKFSPISAQDVADAVVYALASSPGNCPDLIEIRPTQG